MANNMIVHDKNMRRKLMANAIINHSGGYVSKKKIHERIEATSKAFGRVEREEKKKNISKAIHRRGAGCDLIGPGYLPDRDYNCPVLPEGFIPPQIYKDDMRRDLDGCSDGCSDGGSDGGSDGDCRRLFLDLVVAVGLPGDISEMADTPPGQQFEDGDWRHDRRLFPEGEAGRYSPSTNSMSSMDWPGGEEGGPPGYW
jgi:hypothetical protein